jgi:hypothetical protein
MFGPVIMKGTGQQTLETSAMREREREREREER